MKLAESQVQLEIKPQASGSEEGCKVQPKRAPTPLYLTRYRMPAHADDLSATWPHLCAQFRQCFWGPVSLSASYSFSCLLSSSPCFFFTEDYLPIHSAQKPLKQPQQDFLSLYPLRPLQNILFSWCLKVEEMGLPPYLKGRCVPWKFRFHYAKSSFSISFLFFGLIVEGSQVCTVLRIPHVYV